MKKNADKLQKVIQKVSTLVELFSHFTNNEWVYESVKLNDYLKLMTAEEKNEFQIDVKTIDWEIAVWRYAYGMQKYYFNQDVYELTEMGVIIQKNTTPFQDFKFAFLNDSPISKINSDVIRKRVLNSEILRNQIRAEVLKAKNGQIKSPEIEI